MKSPQSLLHALKTGELTSLNLTAQFINANKGAGALNALCLPLYQTAMLRAAQLDEKLSTSGPQGPLHGLPITIKECFDLPGTASTFGVCHRKNDIPETPDMYVEALLDAGAVVLGKSNVSQLLAFIESDNPVYGRTVHPVNPDFSCGGSSGGEGALVGAGLSPLGLGNDIGGSVRVPAAVNGACGIKPTGERLPDKTRLMPQQEALPVRSAAGPISQDAFTLYTALEVMNQKASQHWHVEPLLDYRKVDISGLKIGYFVEDGVFPVAPSVKAGVDKAVFQLKQAGAQVIEYRFPDLLHAEDLFYASMSIDKGRFLMDVLRGEKPVKNLSLLSKIAPLPYFTKCFIAQTLSATGQKHEARILKLLGRFRMRDVPYLDEQVDAYRQDVLNSMGNSAIGKLDAVISPILPVPAYLHNSFKDMTLGGTYSLINNVTGFPAGIARVGKVDESHIRHLQTETNMYSVVDMAERQAKACALQSIGLPMAVQITAMPWREDIVLALIDELHVRAK